MIVVLRYFKFPNNFQRIKPKFTPTPEAKPLYHSVKATGSVEYFNIASIYSGASVPIKCLLPVFCCYSCKTTFTIKYKDKSIIFAKSFL